MALPSFSLEGKVAVVTGGRRGIGKTFALAFAEAGADVAVCDYTDEGGELEAVERGIKEFGRRALTLMADITIKSDVERIFKETVDKLGTVDILVNNAGIIAPSDITDVEEEVLDRMFDTHIKGYYLCSQAAARVMIPKKSGCILNMGSISGLMAMPPNRTAYCVAKAAVHMLTRGLARELGPYNIRVNAISPWVVETQLSLRIQTDPQLREQFLARTPLGRFAETTDLVGAALFLTSDASSWVTGHCLVVDGGMTA